MATTTAQQQDEERERELAELVPPFRPRNSHEVRIRMYGQGLGDCFLLAFPRARPAASFPTADLDRPVYVLIDCGVITGTPDASRRMKRIVRDIRLSTADDDLEKIDGESRGHLDLLILTHEHWDHLSGFIDAQDEWNLIKVDQLWMSWLEEDGRDGLAKALQKLKDRQKRALVEVMKRAAAAPPQESRLRAAAEIATFLGVEFAAGRSLADGLKFAKERVSEDGTLVLCEPGEVHAVPGTDTVAYVLGPPQDWDWLNTMNPSARNPETYANGNQRLALANSLFALDRMLDHRSEFNAFVAPLLSQALAATDEATDDVEALSEEDLFERSFPFDRSVRVPVQTAEAASVNSDSRYPALSSYFDTINQWRRIDFDWLGAADSFALKVDNFINNTSLAIAFELPPYAGEEQKALLFVADAQVGNWLSWDDIKAWRAKPDAKPSQETPNLDDLFKRVAFYKVGHHGSHNATLKEKGIERMRDDGQLTAFVPVSRFVAHQIKGWDEMPLQELLNALGQRTQGKVIFPNGSVWDHTNGEEHWPNEKERQHIGLEVSDFKLSEKRPEHVIDPTGAQFEDKVPLWVQIAVSY